MLTCEHRFDESLIAFGGQDQAAVGLDCGDFQIILFLPYHGFDSAAITIPSL